MHRPSLSEVGEDEAWRVVPSSKRGTADFQIKPSTSVRTFMLKTFSAPAVRRHGTLEADQLPQVSDGEDVTKLEGKNTNETQSATVTDRKPSVRIPSLSMESLPKPAEILPPLPFLPSLPPLPILPLPSPDPASIGTLSNRTPKMASTRSARAQSALSTTAAGPPTTPRRMTTTTTPVRPTTSVSQPPLPTTPRRMTTNTPVRPTTTNTPVRPTSAVDLDDVPVGLPKARSELTPTQVASVLSLPQNYAELFEAISVEKKTERDEIAEELVTSEQSYLRYLMVLKHLFQKPLNEARKQKRLPITKKQLTLLFGNLDQIIPINAKLLKDLIAKMKKWNQHQMLGELLQELTPYLKHYGHYLDNYDQALDVFNKIRRNDVIQSWLSSRMADTICDGLSFEALLIQPIQRVPRYRLLIQRLMICTPQDHMDYPYLRVALDRMEEVASEINTATEIQKERDRLLQVAAQFDIFEYDVEPLAKPGRKFIAETDVQKVQRKGNIKRRRLFLFNDILIVAHPPIGQFRILSYVRIKLKGASVSDVPHGRYANLFEIVSKETSFTAVAFTAEQKEEWVQLLSTTIRAAQAMVGEELTPSQAKPLAVAFQPDYEAKSCTLCNEKFTMTYRRHHCRQCGRVVCQPCSKYKRELASRQNKARVCCVCFTKPQDWRPEGMTLKSAMSREEDEDDEDNLEISKIESPLSETESLETQGRKSPPTRPRKRDGDERMQPIRGPIKRKKKRSRSRRECSVPENSDSEETLEYLLKKAMEDSPSDGGAPVWPSQEYECVASLLQIYPDGVDEWLLILKDIALGKLDPKLFPKNKIQLEAAMTIT